MFAIAGLGRRGGSASHDFADGTLVRAAVVAWADHGGPLRDAPMSALASALVFAGLALLVGAVVVVVIALLTRRAGSGPAARD